jgi:biofilm protein TabA
MVIDKLENLERYVPLHPLFAEAVAFLKTTDLRAHEAGKVVLKEGELMVNFADACPKTKEEALLETHNDFIDIQIPLSGVEVMGYTPRTDLPEAVYNVEKDITFYEGLATNYLTVKPGMFTIFFPEDAHAPGITPDGVRKVIVKVRVK